MRKIMLMAVCLLVFADGLISISGSASAAPDSVGASTSERMLLAENGDVQPRCSRGCRWDRNRSICVCPGEDCDPGCVWNANRRRCECPAYSEKGLREPMVKPTIKDDRIKPPPQPE